MKYGVIALTLGAAFMVAGAPAHAQLDASVSTEVEVSGKSGAHRQDGKVAGENAAREPKTGAASSSSAHAAAETHRSAVAEVVASLLAVSERSGGIGAEVRAVAQSQQETASSTAEAVAKVAGRSAVMSFLFGTDWKSLGEIRSAVARGNADIARLERAAEDAGSASVRAELEAQIEALATEQEELAAFVAEHESKFNLFGWFTKLFVEAEA